MAYANAAPARMYSIPAVILFGVWEWAAVACLWKKQEGLGVKLFCTFLGGVAHIVLLSQSPEEGVDYGQTMLQVKGPIAGCLPGCVALASPLYFNSTLRSSERVSPSWCLGALAFGFLSGAFLRTVFGEAIKPAFE